MIEAALRRIADGTYGICVACGGDIPRKRLEALPWLADAVLLETGVSRQQHLTLRRRILRWQPRLRMLFITRVALWRYRLQVPGFEMPAPVARAQQEFDKRLADVLDGMANRMSGKTSDRHNGFRISVEDLEKTGL